MGTTSPRGHVEPEKTQSVPELIIKAYRETVENKGADIAPPRAGRSLPEMVMGESFARLQEIADRLLSPHADRVYVTAGYTKADLRNDILKAIGKK